MEGFRGVNPVTLTGIVINFESSDGLTHMLAALSPARDAAISFCLF